MSEVFHGSRIFNATITKNKLAPEVLAELAGGQTAAQVDAKIELLKQQLFGGNVAAALDTFKELAEALSADQSGLTALQNVVAGKAAPADITTAVEAMKVLLLGGASEDSNTLKKLEVLVKAAQQAAVNAVADGSITNAKMAADTKIGSLNAASNAFPVAVQSGLTSVEKFLVYLAQQLSSVQSSGGSQQATSSNQEGRIVTLEQALPNKASQADFNALGQRVGVVEQALPGKAAQTDLTAISGRVSTLEARPVGNTYPTQTGNSGKALLTDGAGVYWGTVATQSAPSGGLTANSVDNSHLVADIKAGSIEDANTFLATAASSLTGLIKALYTKIQGGAPVNYQTFGQLKERIAEVSAQASTGVAANSITNGLLAPDVKVGSIATTVAVFPTVDQAGLNDVGAMIRYIWNKVKFVNQAVLEFSFELDYQKTKRILIGANQAGTFGTVQTSNAASYEVRRVSNNQVVGFPATFAAGEFLDVSVVPADFSKPVSLIIFP